MNDEIVSEEEIIEELWKQARMGLLDVRWNGDTPTFKFTQKGHAEAERLLAEMVERVKDD